MSKSVFSQGSSCWCFLWTISVLFRKIPQLFSAGFLAYVCLCDVEYFSSISPMTCCFSEYLPNKLLRATLTLAVLSRKGFPAYRRVSQTSRCFIGSYQLWREQISRFRDVGSVQAAIISQRNKFCSRVLPLRELASGSSLRLPKHSCGCASHTIQQWKSSEGHISAEYTVHSTRKREGSSTMLQEG